jgi:hypothetical protein
MGIWSFFSQSKSPPRETPWEIVETHLTIADLHYQVAVKKGQSELYAENLFDAAKNLRDLTFSRFLLLQEEPPRPHFAPSVKEAVRWFLGRNLPKDGYGNIWWGDKFVFRCFICQACRGLPLQVTAVEHLTVSTDIPHSLSIEGWRVIEVETELTGKGTPTKRMDLYTTVPTINWRRGPNQYFCRRCSEKLEAVGRGSEVAGCFVFDTK